MKLRLALLLAAATVAAPNVLVQTRELLAQESTSAANPALDPVLAAWINAGGKDASKLPASVLDKELTVAESKQLGKQLWSAWQAAHREQAAKAIADKSLNVGDVELKWLERRFGDDKAESRPLFISMHGGGGAPKAVNDQQWQNQIRLYEPSEGIVVAPRAPGNTWDLWHQGHIDPLFDELITSYVIAERVDPNRVYLMGYSAGGDGVYQVAPRMADRFAAASMMAGHPNETQAFGLRNLPFAIFMGGNDSAYNRNKIAGEWSTKLDELQKADADGYVHISKIYPGKGHWMDREDREALPWMLGFQRRHSPKVVKWRQDDVTHSGFYWLELAEPSDAKAGQEVTAVIDGQTIAITTESTAKLRLRLSDELVDLEQPVKVTWNGKSVFEGRVKRTAGGLVQTLAAYRDPFRMRSAAIEVGP
ncbi:MAG: dienelactone hydrolase family protein [Pirellulales bacterium]